MDIYITAIAAIVAAFIGAKVGGKHVERGVLLSAEIARNDSEKAALLEISNFRKALLAEITFLINSYFENIGNVLDAHDEKQPFLYIYPTAQRYFVIYEENADLIGKIKNDHERELIVRCY
ncbi:MAG: hypothetical protein RDU24_13700, partial [Humidesulfovibrio sp.]|uniref:hypothetical protein n=1 Tax=Humidesulfovibrio sp. TaxID=2910988 RepID=UPI0027EBC49A